MKVSWQVAYAEACAALGDALVQQRFLQAELERRDQIASQIEEGLQEGSLEVVRDPADETVTAAG